MNAALRAGLIVKPYRPYIALAEQINLGRCFIGRSSGKPRHRRSAKSLLERFTSGMWRPSMQRMEKNSQNGSEQEPGFTRPTLQVLRKGAAEGVVAAD
jgi:hypothetical protein